MDKQETFLAILAYGKLSVLELASLIDSNSMNFETKWIGENSVLIESDSETMRRLAKRAGGIFKIAKICGETLDKLVECLPLPFEPKFNWTISCYDTRPDVCDEARQSVGDFLKSKSLQKSRFLPPDLESDNNDRDSSHSFDIQELKLKELNEKVLSSERKRPAGFDIILQGGVKADETLYGYTTNSSDIEGFEKRDLARSYQDPTTTIGPRLARVLVNLAIGRKEGSLLDPFCGLGTILQEALICGYSAVGIDIVQANVQKARTNLAWLRKENGFPSKLWYRVLRGDATRLETMDLPEIDAVATEPILIKKFDQNPSFSKAENVIRESSRTYESSLRSLGKILHRQTKVSIVLPEVIDDRGKAHAMKIPDLGEIGLEQYQPRGSIAKFGYPIRVPTTKKKVVQRNVYVMEVR